MSWIDNVNKDFTITTGDGVKFIVNWMNANRAVDFNTSQFNFVNVEGTLVVRKSPMGCVYDIEIYFQGDDNLIKGNDFLDSAKNKKAWRVSHPMYGTLFVQPLSLKLDDSNFNATRITGTIMETIGASNVITNISPIDTIQAQKLSTDIAFSQSYAVDVIPLVSDIGEMKGNITIADRLQVAFATINEDAELVRNTYSLANSYIDKAFSDAFTAVRGIQTLLSLPAVFENTIFNRVNFLIRQSLELYADVTNLHTPHLKKLYENNIGAIISSICSASVTNISTTDYANRGDVVVIISLLTDTYNGYLTNLDSLQTATGGTPNSYIPDFESLNQLGNLVSFTISNLFDIAANAKQQRFVTLSRDSNIVLLAYEIYGLLPDDSTIYQIMSDNNICLNEIMQVKKGREIIYYV